VGLYFIFLRKFTFLSYKESEKDVKI
jgi:hypothetical protein